MSRLFLRIWLWFWLATLLLGAVLFVAQRQWTAQYGGDRGMELVRALGSAAASTVANGGPRALERWRRHVERHNPGRFYLLGPDNLDVGERPLPPPLRAELDGLAPETAVQRWTRRGHLLTLPLEGTPYRAVVIMPHGGWRFAGLPGWLKAVIAVLISGLVCLALAHWLTRPVRRVREATQRLAAGDLSVRIGNGLGRRRDEIGQLARDFDRMAERLEALMQAQSRLLRDVSHELRSPLARLQVALELARQRAGEGAEPALDRIEREAERLNELIGQVLALARYEAGRVSRRWESVDVVTLAEQVVRDVDFEARSSARSVRLEAQSSPTCRGDVALLRSAVENVIRNAVRYTPPETTVEVVVSSRSGGVRIQVRDHGPGVPEADLPRLFEPFVRVGSARDRRSGGYGLGLAIAQRAVAVHGGTIRAENAVNGGLLVTLELRAADPEPVEVSEQLPDLP